MTRTDPTELVLSIERTLPVTEWRYRDVDLWPLLRQQIWLRQYYADEVGARGSSSRLAKGFTLGRDQSRWAQARWADRGHESALDAGAEVVVLGGGGVDRVRQRDGAWFDRWGDSLGELFQDAGARTLQLDPHHTYRTPRQRPSRLIQPVLDVLSLRARLSDATLETATCTGLQQLLAGGGQPLLRDASDGAYVDLAASWFQRLLLRSGARLAVYVDWGPTSQAFALAARRAGILSVEVQHGVHDRDHPHYGTWEALKPGGYSVHPDLYWAWRDDASLIPDWASPGQRSAFLVGGNPPLERWLRSAPATAISPHQRTALVTLQPGRQSGGDLGAVLAAMTAEPRQWTWWLRHHPRASEQEKAALAQLVRNTGAVVETARASSAPLLQLLQEVDAHVTVTSSAVIEAAALGVRSILLGAEEAARLFAVDLASGSATLADSGSTLLTALDEAAAQRGRPRPVSDLPRSTAAALIARGRQES